VTVTEFAPFYRQLVEATIGRKLRQAETVIDVLKLNDALNAAKDDLHAAIEREKRRAIRRAVLRHGRLSIDTTRPMLEPLEQLFRLGRDEGYTELVRAGYQPRRAYVAEPKYDPLLRQSTFLRTGLHNLAVKVHHEQRRVEADLGEASTAAVANSLYRVLGSRDLASRVISSALTAGLGQTFEANADLVGGWEYTAVLDGATCEECEPLDGEQYDTLDALFEVLPDFGPNPQCLGEGRCRCRAVPIGA
jgi:hypothetical protein